MTPSADVPHGSKNTRYRWFLAVLTVVVLGLGVWGQWLYEARHAALHSPDFLTVLYHTLQLFVVHGVHLESPIPLQLHIARLLGAALLFAAAVYAFAAFFRKECLLFRLWLPWRRNHVVICGLGDLGLRLAVDGRRLGKFIVAIEKGGDRAALAKADHCGVLVIDGDACDPAVLRRARVRRAEFVVAACQEDRVNIAIAFRVGELLPTEWKRKKPLVCRLLLTDASVRTLLADPGMFPSGLTAATVPRNERDRPLYRVNFSDLDLYDTAARQLFRIYPLDFKPIGEQDDTIVRLVMIGFGTMGRSIALRAAQMGHFANEATKGHKLRLSVVDRGVAARVAELRRLYPKLEQICTLDSAEIDPQANDAAEALEAFIKPTAGNELLTCVVCVETRGQASDKENMRLGVEIFRRIASSSAQVLVYQHSQCGFASVIDAAATGVEADRRIHTFGTIEEIFTWDTLLRESEDQVARAINEDYRQQRIREGAKESECLEWEDLTEGMQESNRQAADHIPIKLRAVGYHDAPIEPGKKRIQRFSSDKIDLLAHIEHLRWCAERWLDDWEHADETDRARKLSRYLVSWDELSPKDERKDHEQIRAIPRVLEAIGRGIYE